MSKRYKLKRRERYYRRAPDFTITDEDNPPCWCGVENHYYAEVGGNCGGTGMLDCHCGGDLCVCHNHGEVECFGCPGCEPDDDRDEYDDDYD